MLLQGISVTRNSYISVYEQVYPINVSPPSPPPPPPACSAGYITHLSGLMVPVSVGDWASPSMTLFDLGFGSWRLVDNSDDEWEASGWDGTNCKDFTRTVDNGGDSDTTKTVCCADGDDEIDNDCTTPISLISNIIRTGYVTNTTANRWYTFTTSGGSGSIHITAGNHLLHINVYTGTDCGSLDLFASEGDGFITDKTFDLSGAPAGTYRIQLEPDEATSYSIRAIYP